MASLSSSSFTAENRRCRCTLAPTCSHLFSSAPYMISSASRFVYISFSRSVMTKNCKCPGFFPVRFYPFPSSLFRHPSSCVLRCRAGSPGLPPSDPMPEEDELPFEGIFPTLSKLPNTVRIFLAVLLWMSLFFWASAWDGRNGGKRNKGNRFKR